MASIWNRVSNWMSGSNNYDDGYDQFEEVEVADPTPIFTNQPDLKVNHSESRMMIHSKENNKKVMQNIKLFEPRVFEDIKGVANYVIKGQAAIVSVRKVDAPVAHRLLDFLNGAVFAIDGKVTRLNDEIFLCTPSNYMVEGDMNRETQRHIRELRANGGIR